MRDIPRGESVPILHGGTSAQAYVPHPLPLDPALDLDELQDLILNAHVSLGRLDSITDLLPDTHLFLYMYIRKEALLSSQIEGTKSSFSDLLLFELEETGLVEMDEVVEVSNYVSAFDYGIERVRSGFPVCNRLLKEIHTILLKKGRGSNKSPGEFRREQNWLGGLTPAVAEFVPPPADSVEPCMKQLEDFINDVSVRTPVLLKAAFAHVQFETIHPFLGGNGRLGRLLITLLLIEEGILREPMLYLSYFFKSNKQQYFDLLQEVRTKGHWKEWIKFFMTGVIETSAAAINTARSLNDIYEDDRQKIQTLGRSSGSALQVHYALRQKPILSTRNIITMTGLTAPTVNAALASLQKLGLVGELTGRRRNRVFAYDRYLNRLSEGTELAQ